MESIEKDFEDFFGQCRQKGYSVGEMLTICRPLIWQNRYNKIKSLALVLLLPIVVYLLYSWCDSFAWFLSAIGRLVLIQVLPLWNWIPLYNAKCLIERPLGEDQAAPLPRLSRFETDPSNCGLCETLERISTATNVTFSFLEANFLERGLPVIVTDSHAPKPLQDFLNVLLMQAADFLQSNPCDVSTNLMLRRMFDLGLALQKIKTSHPLDKWFLQARSCQFKAVKASRIFVTRPYYYPLHLEPFYSSWILMSNNYVLPERDLYLQGLVFMQQLSGHFDVHLRPKQPCERNCPVVNIRLGAGECLVFSTDLWIVSYGTDTPETKVAATATILEIDWQL